MRKASSAHGLWTMKNMPRNQVTTKPICEKDVRKWVKGIYTQSINQNIYVALQRRDTS